MFRKNSLEQRKILYAELFIAIEQKMALYRQSGEKCFMTVCVKPYPYFLVSIFFNLMPMPISLCNTTFQDTVRFFGHCALGLFLWIRNFPVILK